MQTTGTMVEIIFLENNRTHTVILLCIYIYTYTLVYFYLSYISVWHLHVLNMNATGHVDPGINSMSKMAFQSPQFSWA